MFFVWGCGILSFFHLVFFVVLFWDCCWCGVGFGRFAPKRGKEGKTKKERKKEKKRERKEKEKRKKTKERMKASKTKMVKVGRRGRGQSHNNNPMILLPDFVKKEEVKRESLREIPARKREISKFCLEMEEEMDRESLCVEVCFFFFCFFFCLFVCFWCLEVNLRDCFFFFFSFLFLFPFLFFFVFLFI